MLIILPAYLTHTFLGLGGCQTKILFCTLVGCVPENRELENQHWTSSNPHRLWQCIKQIKPCWHARLSEERYSEKHSAWHQLIDSLFSQPCEYGIGFHLPYWRFILKQNVPAMSIEKLLACQWKCLQHEVLSKWDVFILQKFENCLFITNSDTKMSVVERITILNWNARPSLYKLFLLLILPLSKLKIAYNFGNSEINTDAKGPTGGTYQYTVHAPTMSSEF